MNSARFGHSQPLVWLTLISPSISSLMAAFWSVNAQSFCDENCIMAADIHRRRPTLANPIEFLFSILVQRNATAELTNRLHSTQLQRFWDDWMILSICQYLFVEFIAQTKSSATCVCYSAANPNSFALRLSGKHFDWVFLARALPLILNELYDQLKNAIQIAKSTNCSNTDELECLRIFLVTQIKTSSFVCDTQISWLPICLLGVQ